MFCVGKIQPFFYRCVSSQIWPTSLWNNGLLVFLKFLAHMFRPSNYVLKTATLYIRGMYDGYFCDAQGLRTAHAIALGLEPPSQRCFDTWAEAKEWTISRHLGMHSPGGRVPEDVGIAVLRAISQTHQGVQRSRLLHFGGKYPTPMLTKYVSVWSKNVCSLFIHLKANSNEGLGSDVIL